MKLRFLTSREVWVTLTAESLCPSAMVFYVHDSALVEEDALSSTLCDSLHFDDHSYSPVDINKVGRMKVS